MSIRKGENNVQIDKELSTLFDLYDSIAMGRFDFLSKEKQKMKYKVVAIQDDLTCDNCRANHGKIIFDLKAQNDHIIQCNNLNTEIKCRCSAIEFHETHGGKRPGAGRKPTPNGDNKPIYCGMLEEELRTDILALPVQARKEALASMVKYAKARADVEHLDILQHVCFDWPEAFE